MATRLDRIMNVLNRDVRSNEPLAASYGKRALRILLIFFITVVLLLMVGCPAAVEDSRRAPRRHYNAARRNYESEPSAETQREVETARLEVEESKRLRRRDLVRSEICMLGIIGVSVYAFIRAGRSTRKISGA